MCATNTSKHPESQNPIRLLKSAILSKLKHIMGTLLCYAIRCV